MSSSDRAVRYHVNQEDPTASFDIRKSFQGQVDRKYDATLSSIDHAIRDTAGDATVDRYARELDRILRGDVLGELPQADIDAGHHWTGGYVRQAYQRGLELAQADLRELGLQRSSIRSSTRYFDEAHQGVQTGLYQEAYDVLTAQIDTILDQLRPRLESATTLKERVDATYDRVNRIGRTRGRAHANTMVVSAVNDALLTAFDQTEVQQVGVAVEGEARTNVLEVRVNMADGLPELGGAPDPREPGEVTFVTAGDDKVCPVCTALSGTVQAIRDIAPSEGKLRRPTTDSVIPVHPNCRCRWVPVPP